MNAIQTILIAIIAISFVFAFRLRYKAKGFRNQNLVGDLLRSHSVKYIENMMKNRGDFGDSKYEYLKKIYENLEPTSFFKPNPKFDLCELNDVMNNK